MLALNDVEMLQKRASGETINTIYIRLTKQEKNMKTVKLISAIILTAIMASCGGKQQSTNDIITVNVNANYPEKELVLQDFMDVEYIPLETNDEFITQGSVKAIGKNILVVTNWINDGDIFIFDRSGKGMRKINNFGQSGEEYTDRKSVV